MEKVLASAASVTTSPRTGNAASAAVTVAPAKPKDDGYDFTPVTALKDPVKTIAKKTGKLILGDIGSVGISLGVFLWTIGYGAVSPFVGALMGGVQGLQSGATGKPNADSVFTGKIGAYIHNAVKEKTRSNALAVAAGVIGGGIGDAVYSAADVANEFHRSITELGGNALSAISRWEAR